MSIARYAPILVSALALAICLSLLVSGVEILQVLSPILTYPPTATIGTPLTVGARCLGDAVNYLDCYLALVCNGATVATNYSYTSRSIAGPAWVTISVTYTPSSTGTCIVTATDYGWNSYTSFNNHTSATITVVTSSTPSSTSSTTTTTTTTSSTSTTPTSSTATTPTTSSTSHSIPFTPSSPSSTSPSGRGRGLVTIAILAAVLIALLVLARRGGVSRY